MTSRKRYPRTTSSSILAATVVGFLLLLATAVSATRGGKMGKNNKNRGKKKKQPVQIFVLAGDEAAEGYASVAQLRKLLVPKKDQQPNKFQQQFAHLLNENKSAFAVPPNVFCTSYEHNERGFSTGPLVTGQFGASAPQFFGPEVELGHVLSAIYPNSSVIIVKAAWSRHTLAVEFLPPSSSVNKTVGRSYQRLLDSVNHTTSQLQQLLPPPLWRKSSGSYELGGLIWFHGASDLLGGNNVEDYQHHLQNLLRDLRTDLAPYLKKKQHLNIVVGEVLMAPKYTHPRSHGDGPSRALATADKAKGKEQQSANPPSLAEATNIESSPMQQEGMPLSHPEEADDELVSPRDVVRFRLMQYQTVQHDVGYPQATAFQRTTQYTRVPIEFRNATRNRQQLDEMFPRADTMLQIGAAFAETLVDLRMIQQEAKQEKLQTQEKELFHGDTGGSAGVKGVVGISGGAIDTSETDLSSVVAEELAYTEQGGSTLLLLLLVVVLASTLVLGFFVLRKRTKRCGRTRKPQDLIDTSWKYTLGVAQLMTRKLRLHVSFTTSGTDDDYYEKKNDEWHGMDGRSSETDSTDEDNTIIELTPANSFASSQSSSPERKSTTTPAAAANADLLANGDNVPEQQAISQEEGKSGGDLMALSGDNETKTMQFLHGTRQVSFDNSDDEGPPPPNKNQANPFRKQDGAANHQSMSMFVQPSVSLTLTSSSFGSSSSNNPSQHDEHAQTTAPTRPGPLILPITLNSNLLRRRKGDRGRRRKRAGDGSTGGASGSVESISSAEDDAQPPSSKAAVQEDDLLLLEPEHPDLLIV